MNLSDLISKQDVLDEAFNLPVMKIKPRSNRRPDLDTALKATVSAIEKLTIAAVAEQVKELLEPEIEMFILTEGEHESSANKDEWELALDDIVEQAIEPFVPNLSQNWLGVHTIGSGIHLENGLAKFAASLGKEFYKEVTHELGKSPAQIMSSAGVVSLDVETRLAVHNNQSPIEETMTKAPNEDQTLQDVIERIALYLGKDFDANLVYDDLDFASDDDEILAQGALPRLGLDESDIATLQEARMISGTDFIDEVLQGVEAYHEGGKKKKGGKAAKAPAAPKKETKPKAEKPNRASDAKPTADHMPATILLALKDCGVQDTAMAKQLGFSRATYNNYLNGKSEFKPTEDQSTIIRNEVVDRVNKLHEALAAIDGGEPHAVF